MQLLSPLTTGHTALSATVTLPKGASWAPIFGSCVTIGTYREAASQTYDGGELVSLNSSGQVTNVYATADPTAGALTLLNTALDRKDCETLILGMAVSPARNLSAASSNTVDVVLAHGARFFLRFVGATANVTAANMDATSTDSEMSDVVIGKLVQIGRYAGANIASATADTAVGRDCQTIITNHQNATAINNVGRVVQIPSSTYGGPWPPAYYWGGVWMTIEAQCQIFNG